MRTNLILLSCALLALLPLAGCDSEPAARIATPVTAPQEATLEVGDTTIRAGVVQTSALNQQVAGVQFAQFDRMLLPAQVRCGGAYGRRD